MSVKENWNKVLSGSDDAQSGWLRRTGSFWLRLLRGVARKFLDRKLHLQSTSLAYTTLLSLVPLLAVTFSVLKGFGVQNQLEPMLMQSLEPLGAKGAEIGQNILAYVDNLNFAVLGFFGIAFLFWTVISLLQKVEEAFNAIWHAPGVRSLSRRFSDYLSVALVGPVFLVSALGITSIVLDNEFVHRAASVEPFGKLILGVGRAVPYLLVCLAFAFLYAFLTNLRVRLIPALAGGIFASLAWYGVGHLFAHLVANSSRYSAIYSSLAAVVLFIIWVNVGWLIILVGAHIARYWQNPQLLMHQEAEGEAANGDRDALAFDLMTLIGRAYWFDEPKWTRDALAARISCGSPDQLEGLLRSLEDQGLIVATSAEPTAYLPARAIETIQLRDILAAGRPPSGMSDRLPVVKRLIEQIDSVVSDSLGERTLKDLVLLDHEDQDKKS
jgi:membrane protein